MRPNCTIYSDAHSTTQVLSRRQLLSAVFKAVTSAVNGGLKTPNVHSETVVSLNPSNNVCTPAVDVVGAAYNVDCRRVPPIRNITRHKGPAGRQGHIPHRLFTKSANGRRHLGTFAGQCPGYTNCGDRRDPCASLRPGQGAQILQAERDRLAGRHPRRKAKALRDGHSRRQLHRSPRTMRRDRWDEIISLHHSAASSRVLILTCMFISSSISSSNLPASCPGSNRNSKAA